MSWNRYTIQECFEQAGSKFPFKIIWYPESSAHINQEGIYTIISQDPVSKEWNHEKRYGGPITVDYFSKSLASLKQFSYKIIEYQKSFEEIIK